MLDIQQMGCARTVNGNTAIEHVWGWDGLWVADGEKMLLLDGMVREPPIRSREELAGPEADVRERWALLRIRLILSRRFSAQLPALGFIISMNGNAGVLCKARKSPAGCGEGRDTRGAGTAGSLVVIKKLIVFRCAYESMSHTLVVDREPSRPYHIYIGSLVPT